ncbi:hypothetical protein Ahy_A09g045133 isoform B [Arachis hypogaea]|uniref:Uncharacterized protein n=1 Tax=Arachis hypogaea TaxID=3818 RepID=A0A445BLN9_ARAHY|nr:hypothetical protein Ahy_A09g045133 isoform B [Arachis hypogaea]
MSNAVAVPPGALPRLTSLHRTAPSLAAPDLPSGLSSPRRASPRSPCTRSVTKQVCGLINSIGHEYVVALNSYKKDIDEPVHAFSFINIALTVD